MLQVSPLGPLWRKQVLFFSSVSNSFAACWKLLAVFPMLRPTSGNFLGPKTSAATPAMTTSSGTPRPNKQVQVRRFWVRIRVWLRATTRDLGLKKIGVRRREGEGLRGFWNWRETEGGRHFLLLFSFSFPCSVCWRVFTSLESPSTIWRILGYASFRREIQAPTRMSALALVLGKDFNC